MFISAVKQKIYTTPIDEFHDETTHYCKNEGKCFHHQLMQPKSCNCKLYRISTSEFKLLFSYFFADVMAMKKKYCHICCCISGYNHPVLLKSLYCSHHSSVWQDLSISEERRYQKKVSQNIAGRRWTTIFFFRRILFFFGFSFYFRY